MKFSHSLILNAVPDWIEYYIDYDHLKKIVYKIERIRLQSQNRDIHHQLESQHLIDDRQEATGLPSTTTATTARKEGVNIGATTTNEEDDDNKMFLTELDKQLDKITDFFHKKVNEILQDASTLHEQFSEFGIPLSTSDGGVPVTAAEGENDLRKLDSILSGGGDPSLSQPNNIDLTHNVENVNLRQQHNGEEAIPSSSHARSTRRSNSISFFSRGHRMSSATTAAATTASPSPPMRPRRRSETVQGQIQQQFWGRTHPHHQRGQPDSPTQLAANDIATFN
ncbi:unnamed protein product [Absidia cylindrospora]